MARTDNLSLGNDFLLPNGILDLDFDLMTPSNGHVQSPALIIPPRQLGGLLKDETDKLHHVCGSSDREQVIPKGWERFQLGTQHRVETVCMSMDGLDGSHSVPEEIMWCDLEKFGFDLYNQGFCHLQDSLSGRQSTSRSCPGGQRD